MRQAQVDHQQHLRNCHWRGGWKLGVPLLQGKKSVFCLPRAASRLISLLSFPLQFLEWIANLRWIALCTPSAILRFSFGGGEWRDGSASWWQMYEHELNLGVWLSFCHISQPYHNRVLHNTKKHKQWVGSCQRYPLSPSIFFGGLKF